MIRYLLVIVLLLVVGCGNGPRERLNDAEVPLLLEPYADKPAPGTLRAFPHAVRSDSPWPVVGENIVQNPSFENGLLPWALSGPRSSEYSITSMLYTEGDASLQILPSRQGEMVVSQRVVLRPRTFYMFSAFVFLPGDSEVVLEAHDSARDLLAFSEPLQGPRSSWSQVALTFVTGMQAEELTVAIRGVDQGENAPILIDECGVYEIAAQEILRQDTMRNEPEGDQMPEWYVGGASATPLDNVFQGRPGFEVPFRSGRPSDLFCLIPSRLELEGGEVWVSAMIRSEPPGAGEGPSVTMSLRMTDADENTSVVSQTVPGTGEWMEATLHATFPDQLVGENGGGLPFQVLRFERPPGVAGRVLIADVRVLEIPNGSFRGGLVPSW